LKKKIIRYEYTNSVRLEEGGRFRKVLSCVQRCLRSCSTSGTKRRPSLVTECVAPRREEAGMDELSVLETVGVSNLSVAPHLSYPSTTSRAQCSFKTEGLYLPNKAN
jgi:hypothetical protein